MWGGHLPCENDGSGGGPGVPLGWWPHGEAFRVGPTQDMSLSTAVRSGVLGSPLSLSHALRKSCWVWFALLKGYK